MSYIVGGKADRARRACFSSTFDALNAPRKRRGDSRVGGRYDTGTDAQRTGCPAFFHRGRRLCHGRDILLRPRFKLRVIGMKRAVDEQVILPMGKTVPGGDIDLAKKPSHKVLKLLPLATRRV